MNYAIVDLFSREARTLYKVMMGRTIIKIIDYSMSLTAPSVFRDLAEDRYKLNGREFAEGDVIVDIGANVGIVSIYMAKQLPYCTIYAFEPLPMNYAHLCQNITINDLHNVIPVNAAVTADGRPIHLCYDLGNMGGASAFVTQPAVNEAEVESVTLQQIWDRYNINKCAYLKLDCEGAEHEILAASQDALQRVNYCAVEAHINPHIRSLGYSEDTLRDSVRTLAERRAVHVTLLEMAK